MIALKATPTYTPKWVPPAAKMWATGYDTAFIADALRFDFERVNEAIVFKYLPKIKEIARGRI